MRRAPKCFLHTSADRVGNRHSNLRPLERDRLIELTASEEDRRSRRVRLTPAGLAKFEEASALWRTAQTRFESGFGVRPAEKLRKVLRQVAALDFTTSS